jgi:hypothetical protein
LREYVRVFDLAHRAVLKIAARMNPQTAPALKMR